MELILKYGPFFSEIHFSFVFLQDFSFFAIIQIKYNGTRFLIDQ